MWLYNIFISARLAYHYDFRSYAPWRLLIDNRFYCFDQHFESTLMGIIKEVALKKYSPVIYRFLKQHISFFNGYVHEYVEHSALIKPIAKGFYSGTSRLANVDSLAP